MLCPYCGANNPPGAKFCTQCGGALDAKPHVQTPPIPGQVQTPPIPGQGTQQNASQASSTAETATQTSPRKRGPAILVGVIAAITLVMIVTVVAVVSCSIVGGGISARKHGVIFPINIAGGYDNKSSRIPMQITGTDINGNAVDETIFLAYSGVDVELPEGKYEAKVLGSPISSTGTIYKVPSYVASFEVGPGLKEGEDYELPYSKAFSFIAINPKNLTDEQVKDAIAWARKDEKSG
ncbi:MAG: zinc ribbon domain-containing protein, partial [Atopobiaceae bacterium]|nr:zinc ribbon domain-containing protein [Atopobiaceae bacterium]